MARKHKLHEASCHDIEHPESQLGFFEKLNLTASSYFLWGIKLYHLGDSAHAFKFVCKALFLKPFNLKIWKFFIKNLIFQKHIPFHSRCVGNLSIKHRHE